jgi:hypothetical protein
MHGAEQVTNERGESDMYVMKAHADTLRKRVGARLQSGVQELPGARTGQLPLALAEHALPGLEGAEGPRKPLRIDKKVTTVRHGHGQSWVKLHAVCQANQELNQPPRTCLRTSSLASERG